MKFKIAILFSMLVGILAHGQSFEELDDFDESDEEVSSQVLAEMRSVYRDLSHILSKKSNKFVEQACQGRLTQMWLLKLGYTDDSFNKAYTEQYSEERNKLKVRATTLVRAHVELTRLYQPVIGNDYNNIFKTERIFSAPGNLSIKTASQYLGRFSEAFNLCRSHPKILELSAKINALDARSTFRMVAPNGEVSNRNVSPKELDSLLMQGYEYAN